MGDIYDEDKDVDMIIFTPKQFVNNLKSGVAQWIMNRGYYVMYECGGYTETIKQYVTERFLLFFIVYGYWKINCRGTLVY